LTFLLVPLLGEPLSAGREGEEKELKSPLIPLLQSGRREREFFKTEGREVGQGEAKDLTNVSQCDTFII
jgi:hypothetical protein